MSAVLCDYPPYASHVGACEVSLMTRQPTDQHGVGIVYLASPYTSTDPAIVEVRFHTVCRITGQLLNQGYHVLSPIAHSHPVAVACELPKHFEFWRDYDHALIQVCSEVWVCTIPGWRDSVGVTDEKAFARSLGIPVRYVVDLVESVSVQDGEPS